MARFALAFVYYFYNTIVTHVPVYGVRHWYLRTMLGVHLGTGSSIHMGCFVTGGDIAIGKNSVVNRNCYLDGRAGIDIGDNASISAETCIISLGHDPCPRISPPRRKESPSAITCGPACGRLFYRACDWAGAASPAPAAW